MNPEYRKLWRAKRPPSRSITIRLADQATGDRFRLYCHLTKLNQADAFAALVKAAQLPQ